MKIYLETKDKDNHRIVFEGDNGKLVYSGEWVRRKSGAYQTLTRFLECANDWCGGYHVDERPYKPGAFAKNSGPKSKSSTTKKKK